MKKLKTIHGDTILVDNDDYEIAKQYNWSVKLDVKSGRREIVTYSKNKDIADKEISPEAIPKEIISKQVLQKGISYKRLILGLASKVALFRNENPFDLRKENLIVFNTVEEFDNIRSKLHKLSRETNLKIRSRIPKNAKGGRGGAIPTKYLGIQCQFPDNPHPWVSTIRQKKIIYRLGSYAKEEHAALAYDKKAIELFGSDVVRNFPNLMLEEVTEKLEKIKAEDAIIFEDYRSKSLQGTNFDVPKTSRYIGVHFSKASNKWSAGIDYRGKQYYLGLYDTEKKAAVVYDRKAIEFYGKTAKVNFPHLIPLVMKELTPERLEEIKEEIEEEREFQELRSQCNQGQIRDVKKTSKYVGVHFYKQNSGRTRKWKAKITYHRTLYPLGYYATEEEAARAYDKKALELYGKDAKLNFPIKKKKTLSKLPKSLKIDLA